jgi:hypothetical protein
LDNDTASAEAPAEKPPRWNIVSVAVPLAAAAVGVVQASGVSSGGNVGVAMGAAFAFIAFVVVGCAIGLVAALIAVVRSERMAWLSVLGLLGNGAVILPIVFFLLKG